MTRAEISAFFPPAGLVGAPHFGAMSYAVPTLAWLRGPFWDFFKTRYWETNSDKWKFRWECRDFTRAYACAAQECWGNMVATGAAAADDGLTVGEIWFIPDAYDASKGHAIAPAITDVGRVFIDPQTNQLCNLTDAQIASRYFLRW